MQPIVPLIAYTYYAILLYQLYAHIEASKIITCASEKGRHHDTLQFDNNGRTSIISFKGHMSCDSRREKEKKTQFGLNNALVLELPLEFTYIMHLNYLTDNRMIGLSVQRVCCRQFDISTVQGEFTKLNTHVLLSAYSYTTMHAP